MKWAVRYQFDSKCTQRRKLENLHDLIISPKPSLWFIFWKTGYCFKRKRKKQSMKSWVSRHGGVEMRRWRCLHRPRIMKHRWACGKPFKITAGLLLEVTSCDFGSALWDLAKHCGGFVFLLHLCCVSLVCFWCEKDLDLYWNSETMIKMIWSIRHGRICIFK